MFLGELSFFLFLGFLEREDNDNNTICFQEEKEKYLQIWAGGLSGDRC